LRLGHITPVLIIIGVFPWLITLSFLNLLVANRLSKRFIQFLNPALNAAKMEWSVTLLAIPECRSLVDLVLTNDALLATRCQ